MLRSARNDGNGIFQKKYTQNYIQKILILFICNLCAISFLFSQQYIHTLGKDSINQSDWIGKQGLWYVFDDSTGLIYSKTTYENNLKHGYFEEYDVNGKTVRQGFYKYGMLDSLYQEYENGEIVITAYFDYGIPVGIISKSGEKIYEIKCNDEFKGTYVNSTDLIIKDGEIIRAAEQFINDVICNDSNDIVIYTFSYYDKEEDKNYIQGVRGKRCIVCPKLDTVCNFMIESIYYNGCIYKEIYYKIRVNRNWIREIEEFFIDEKRTMTILYRSKKPHNIKGIAYYNKDNYIYKTEEYNKKGILKKIYQWQLTPKGKWIKYEYKSTNQQ